MEIYILMPDGKKKIKAQEIRIEGQEDLRFFFHKTQNKQWYDGKYTITEFSTGMAVCKLDSKKECINKLQDRLKQYPPKEMLKIAMKTIDDRKIKYPVNHMKSVRAVTPKRKN